MPGWLKPSHELGGGGADPAARGGSPAGHVGLEGPGVRGASASACPHRAGQSRARGRRDSPRGAGRGAPRCPPALPTARLCRLLLPLPGLLSSRNSRLGTRGQAAEPGGPRPAQPCRAGRRLRQGASPRSQQGEFPHTLLSPPAPRDPAGRKRGHGERDGNERGIRQHLPSRFRRGALTGGKPPAVKANVAPGRGEQHAEAPRFCPGPAQSRDGARGAERGSPQPTGAPSWVWVPPLSRFAGSQVGREPWRDLAGVAPCTRAGRAREDGAEREEPGPRSPSAPRGAGRARGTDRPSLPNGKIRGTLLLPVVRAIPVLRVP